MVPAKDQSRDLWLGPILRPLVAGRRESHPIRLRFRNYGMKDCPNPGPDGNEISLGESRSANDAWRRVAECDAEPPGQLRTRQTASLFGTRVAARRGGWLPGTLRL